MGYADGMSPLFADSSTFVIIPFVVIGALLGIYFRTGTMDPTTDRLKRIESKLDEIRKHLGLDEPRHEWQNICDEGPDRKYAAIKSLIDEKGLEWSDAQRIVEDYIARKMEEAKWN